MSGDEMSVNHCKYNCYQQISFYCKLPTLMITTTQRIRCPNAAARHVCAKEILDVELNVDWLRNQTFNIFITSKFECRPND